MPFPRTTTSKLFALSLCLAAIAPAARADDATHRAKVEEMLRLTKTESGLHEQLTNLQNRIDELSKQQFNLPAPTAEQTALLAEYHTKIQQITTEEVGWEGMRPKLIALYSESFTDADLDGINAFYKSPAGQALIAKLPQVSAKSSAIVQDRIKELQPKLQTLTLSYAEKMKLTPPAGAAPAAAQPAPSLKTPAKP